MTQQLITDINENELAEGDRVVEPYGDSYPRVGTIDVIEMQHSGSVYVTWDGDDEAHAIFPTRLEKIED